jgi:hypothetical protein
MKGLGHVPRPRDFHTVSIAYNLKSLLAKCFRAFLTFTPEVAKLQSLSLSPMKKPTTWPAFSLVGMKGLEPSRLAARAPKARVYTNFTTSPRPSVRHYLVLP